MAQSSQPESSQPSQNARASRRQRLQQSWLKLARHTGKSVLCTSGALVDTVGRLGKAAAQTTVRSIEYTTHTAGQVMTLFGKVPFVRRFAGVLKLDWLVTLTDQVDVVKAVAAVRELEEQYPNETPKQISHRIMVRKALLAGGIGLASSVLPGVATALLAVDLAATTALQTEMVYQIAAAYGMDLSDAKRKGEVLGVFGLALGGRNALRAGLGFLRNVPLAGMLIGAGTNATMLYTLGYAACRFYEAKLESETEQLSDATLDTIQAESEQYLSIAMSQQAVMDQILAHMVLAGHPDKTWDDILPELEQLQFAPESLEAIAQHLKSPEPLGALLQQLDCDFSVPLLSQCLRVAEKDGISEAETEILDAIIDHCNLEDDAIADFITKSGGARLQP